MKVISAGLVLMFAVLLVGCGASEKGPAKPEDTPVVTETPADRYKSAPPGAMDRYKNRMPGPGGS